jgi:hypothetical protein
MKTQTVYLSYIALTPNFENNCFGQSHSEILKPLRDNFRYWNGFFNKYDLEYSIGFIVASKKGTNRLEIKGPTLWKRKKYVDFSIFLPDEIKDLDHYIDLVFEGIGLVLAKYEVPDSVIQEMNSECKKELGL